MSNGQRTSRGKESERARHIASAETAGFATTAATMLLGLVAGAEAREHAAQPQNPQAPAQAPSPAAMHPQAPSAAQIEPAQPHRDASAVHDTPAADPATHTAMAAEAAPHLATLAQASHEQHFHAAGSGRVIEPAAPTMAEHHAVPSPDNVALHAPAPIAPLHLSADTGAIAQHQDPAQPAPLLDGATANLSQIGETVNATLHEMTTTLTNDVAHLVGSLSTMTSNLTSTLTSALSGLSADALHLGVADPLAAATHAAIETPHFDTGGAVPVAFVQLPPVQLGFIGQPTADGHDTHDGAFSALGAHHF